MDFLPFFSPSVHTSGVFHSLHSLKKSKKNKVCSQQTCRRNTRAYIQQNICAYITSLLGSLLYHTDVQVADGKAMLLKYVTSYVTKMHEACSSEGLYSSDVTGYQAAHSFLRTIHPLAPEMIFQLSAIKPSWTNNMTKQFRTPYPDQEMDNEPYQKYLTRERPKENMSLLQWLRMHSIVRHRVKTLESQKYLVGVKFVSVFNPVFFHQYLLLHNPHRHPSELRHLEELTMPSTIRHFVQAVTLQPEKWTTPEQIRGQFEEGHCSSRLTTIVAYVFALHDILQTCSTIMVPIWGCSNKYINILVSK